MPEISEHHAEKARVATLVLGGVRSGKSRYAQQLAERAGNVTFVATAELRDDDEMRAKIKRHQAERPAHWHTVEEPLKLACAIRSADTEIVLIDCLTMFASNLLEHSDGQAIASEINSFCRALTTAACSVILVSNEVGSGVVPAYALGRRFRDLLGEINQRVAATADNVVLLIAGLPLVLKGELPR